MAITTNTGFTRYFPSWSSTFANEADFTVNNPDSSGTPTSVTVEGGYHQGVIVTHNDRTFLCRTTGTTEEPGMGSDDTNWFEIQTGADSDGVDEVNFITLQANIARANLPLQANDLPAQTAGFNQSGEAEQATSSTSITWRPNQPTSAIASGEVRVIIHNIVQREGTTWTAQGPWNADIIPAVSTDDTLTGDGGANGPLSVNLTGGNGIDISSGTVSVDLASNNGLEFQSGELQLNHNRVITRYTAGRLSQYVAGDIVFVTSGAGAGQTIHYFSAAITPPTAAPSITTPNSSWVEITPETGGTANIPVTREPNSGSSDRNALGNLTGINRQLIDDRFVVEFNTGTSALSADIERFSGTISANPTTENQIQVVLTVLNTGTTRQRGLVNDTVTLTQGSNTFSGRIVSVAAGSTSFAHTLDRTIDLTGFDQANPIEVQFLRSRNGLLIDDNGSIQPDLPLRRITGATYSENGDTLDITLPSGGGQSRMDIDTIIEEDAPAILDPRYARFSFDATGVIRRTDTIADNKATGAVIGHFDVLQMQRPDSPGDRVMIDFASQSDAIAFYNIFRPFANNNGVPTSPITTADWTSSRASGTQTRPNQLVLDAADPGFSFNYEPVLNGGESNVNIKTGQNQTVTISIGTSEFSPFGQVTRSGFYVLLSGTGIPEIVGRDIILPTNSRVETINVNFAEGTTPTAGTGGVRVDITLLDGTTVQGVSQNLTNPSVDDIMAEVARQLRGLPEVNAYNRVIYPGGIGSLGFVDNDARVVTLQEYTTEAQRVTGANPVRFVNATWRPGGTDAESTGNDGVVIRPIIELVRVNVGEFGFRRNQYVDLRNTDSARRYDYVVHPNSNQLYFTVLDDATVSPEDYRIGDTVNVAQFAMNPTSITGDELNYTGTVFSNKPVNTPDGSRPGVDAMNRQSFEIGLRLTDQAMAWMLGTRNSDYGYPNTGAIALTAGSDFRITGNQRGLDFTAAAQTGADSFRRDNVNGRNFTYFRLAALGDQGVILDSLYRSSGTSGARFDISTVTLVAANGHTGLSGLQDPTLWTFEEITNTNNSTRGWYLRVDNTALGTNQAFLGSQWQILGTQNIANRFYGTIDGTTGAMQTNLTQVREVNTQTDFVLHAGPVDNERRFDLGDVSIGGSGNNIRTFTTDLTRSDVQNFNSGRWQKTPDSPATITFEQRAAVPARAGTYADAFERGDIPGQTSVSGTDSLFVNHGPANNEYTYNNGSGGTATRTPTNSVITLAAATSVGSITDGDPARLDEAQTRGLFDIPAGAVGYNANGLRDSSNNLIYFRTSSAIDPAGANSDSNYTDAVYLLVGIGSRTGSFRANQGLIEYVPQTIDGRTPTVPVAGTVNAASRIQLANTLPAAAVPVLSQTITGTGDFWFDANKQNDGQTTGEFVLFNISPSVT